MTGILNFFAALADCFCEPFPETLALYKLLLSLDNDEMASVERNIHEWTEANLTALCACNYVDLTPMQIKEATKPLIFQNLFVHPLGQTNSIEIWAHLHAITKCAFPETNMTVAHTATAPVPVANFIQDLLQNTPMPQIDPSAPPLEILDSLVNNEAFRQIVTNIQTQMVQHKQAGSNDFSPANLLLAMSSLLNQ